MSAPLRSQWFGLFLERARRLQCLSSSLLYVLHPELFCLARECLADRIADVRLTKPDDLPYLQQWGSVFTVLDILVNRESPKHMDKEPPAGWLDILFTFGSYHTALFATPTLGRNFYYPPGTAMVLNSSRVLHGASVADGDRAVLIFYLRQHIASFYKCPLVSAVQVGF